MATKSMLLMIELSWSLYCQVKNVRISSHLTWSIAEHFAKKINVLDHWLEEPIVLEAFVVG